MSDLPTVRPKHSRSTSITTSKKTTSHQRKPSLNVQQQQQQQQILQAPKPELKRHSSSRASLNTAPATTSSLPRFVNSIILRVHSFLNPSGPLLPHSKHGNAFGGTAKPSLMSRLAQSRVVRFVALFYVIFSVFLSLNHTWRYLTSSPNSSNNSIRFKQTDATLDEQFNDDWVPQRTYDQDDTYSLMNQMTHGLKMSKLFSKSYYDAAKNIQPFWKKASNIPEKDEVSIITTANADTWKDLKRLTIYWEGPISAIVHIEQDDDATVEKIKQEYENTPELYRNVDLHLAQIPGEKLSVLFPRNAERNLARLLAQTDYIMDLPHGVIPATDLRRTLESNKERIDSLLLAGDLLALPTFNFKNREATRDDVPYDKSQLILKLSEDKMVLDDKHWKENEGPTDLERWMDAEFLYAVEKYEFHYEPVIIESKTIQPWCSERFLDSRAACIFSSYLQGNEIWVLPDDFMVQMPLEEDSEVTDFDNVVENRIYAKFYWEQCVHHARQLDALGLWKSPRSQHIRSQCSRVIQNWGKGLIGKPE
ncbi:glycosyltransferase family 49 protein [Mucor lusitanicus]|uniref:Glycosyltransferase family 49 protein n=2 Tax=Mucor circinelloides f. lusitanicus TaxID=29924 RepID=A0A168PM04_MUCCL|nr:glycosyltransferase family 49 protein [Mucor lusitanicus CBS 277.49]